MLNTRTENDPTELNRTEDDVRFHFSHIEVRSHKNVESQYKYDVYDEQSTSCEAMKYVMRRRTVSTHSNDRHSAISISI